MHIARLPLDAFNLIDENTDVRVIEAIDEHAQNGSLTAAQVKRLIDQQTADLRGELEASNERIVDLTATVAEAQAQAKDAEGEKAKAIAAHDSMVVQLRAQEKVTEDLRATARRSFTIFGNPRTRSNGFGRLKPRSSTWTSRSR
ncbi:hypothetical protein AWV80_10375 [Cupriavidus sp. UYMU48A]|nr:hypothetical protein AWV80_10375 [Cupriavidus sp. UYMU48A]